MSYKLVIVCIVFAICCCGCGRRGEKTETLTNEAESNNREESMGLIEQIFGVSESEYEVIEEINGLDNDKYGGSYRVVLKIKQENMQTFIEEVEKSFFMPENAEDYINNKGNMVGENDIFYVRIGSVKRKIDEEELSPKTCTSYILYSEAIDGVYEVEMKYSE